MAALSTQAISITGITPTFAAATGGGDTIAVGSGMHLVVKNGGGSPITVTIGTFPDTTTWGATIPDLVVTVAAGGEKWIGPLYPENSFADPSDGRAHITYSGVTSVTVGAFRI